eukprot:2560-Heterococcus_DN1.PRE.1
MAALASTHGRRGRLSLQGSKPSGSGECGARRCVFTAGVHAQQPLLTHYTTVAAYIHIRYNCRKNLADKRLRIKG